MALPICTAPRKVGSRIGKLICRVKGNQLNRAAAGADERKSPIGPPRNIGGGPCCYQPPLKSDFPRDPFASVVRTVSGRA